MMHRVRRLERIAVPPSAEMPVIYIVIGDDSIPPGAIGDDANPLGPVHVCRAHPDTTDQNLRAALAALEAKE